MSQHIFFLGGYDAEMIEICNVLQAKGEQFFDKKLPWGACLSAYTAELRSVPFQSIPVLIELKIDRPCPNHAIIIEHHNEKAGKDKKTSIEQVADLLGIGLSRRQKLISANDRGYIMAMREELCATDDEIAEIRALDRKAQGVTDEDEKLAEDSIEKHLEKITDDAIIVNSLTNKTSPVFDRLYDKYRHVFVFTSNGEMNYSGTGETVCRLVEKYKKRKEKDLTAEFWYGGDLPEYGFFGTKASSEVEEIKSMVQDNKKKIISQHIFMFPFRITVGEPSYNHWNPKTFNPKLTGLNYSEYAYLHGYVRDALYQIRQDVKWISKYYELKGFNQTDTISYFIRGKKEPYILGIDNISLRIFETGVGILSFSLLNDHYDKIEDILIINDFGRRVYPEFFPENGDIKVVKDKFLPDKVVLNFSGRSPIEEDFSCLKDAISDDGKIRIGDHITKLLEGIEFIPIIDDRMFTICWYGSCIWSQKLAGNGYKSCDAWHQYIFLDGRSIGTENRRMKEKLIRDNTYERWSDCGTLYGITRYSLMCITDTPTEENFFFPDVIRNHMQTMYFQIATILLAQRASILKFSADVSDISGEIEDFLNLGSDDEEQFRKIADKVKTLHSSFIHFVNRLWFTEVTPQEQGIEMYNMALKNMGLKEQLDEVRHEIKELYEFMDMQYEKMKAKDDRKMNHNLVLLNKLAFILLPLTVVSGLLGMNLFSTDDISNFYEHLPLGILHKTVFLQRAGIFCFLAVVVYFIVFVMKKKYENKKTKAGVE